MSISIYRNNAWETIDGILSGATTTWKADDTLDSAVRAWISTDKTPIKPFTLVALESTDRMFAAGDTVETYAKAGTVKYKHTLVLVELTKILEKIICYGEVSTNTDISLYDQVVRFCDNTNALMNNTVGDIEDRGYKLDAGALYPLLSQVNGEEVVLSKSTAREILDEYLSVVNCRITVSSATPDSAGGMELDLAYVDLNERIPTTIEALQGEELNNDAESFAGSLWTTAENAITPSSVRQIDTFKCKDGDAEANSNNRIMSLAYQIEYPTDFKIKYDGFVSYLYSRGAGTLYSGSINISPYFMDAITYFVDKEYYDTLSGGAEHSYLYYERGATEIDLSRTYKKVLITRTNFSQFLRTVAQAFIISKWDYFKPYDDATFNSMVDDVDYSIDKSIYDLTYQPRLDCMLSCTKESAEHLDSLLNVIDNQSDNVIDIARYGQNLYGKIQRLGNDNYFIDVNVYSYEDIKPLFSEITSDSKKYVVYEVTFADLYLANGGHLYQVRYSLAEGYNNLAEKIGIRREKRIYQIPLVGYKTILPSKTYLYVTSSVVSPHAIVGTHLLPDIIKQTLSSSPTGTSNVARTYTRRIENAVVSVHLSDNTNRSFLLPAISFGAGNTINLSARFYDNYSAGLSINLASLSIFNWVGGKKVSYNPYVDSNGEATAFGCSFGYCPNARTEQGILNQPGWNGYESFTTLRGCQILYKKDRAESISIQAITQIVSSPDIIITKLLAERNIATIGNDIDLYYWKTVTQSWPPKIYTAADTKCVGARMGRVGEYLKSADNSFGIAFEKIQADDYGYSIGDYDGNLYLAVNNYGDNDVGRVILCESAEKIKV